MNMRDQQEWATGKPRYMLLADALLGEILNGAYPVGSKLPTEHELCRRYGVSRYTVRGAMRRLAALGLITRRKSIGTTVISNRPSNTYVHAVASLNELAPLDADVMLQVRKSSLIAADETLSNWLACQPGREWLKLEGLCTRRGDTTPLGWCRVFVDGIYAAIGDHVGRGGLAHELIEKTYGVAIEEIRQTIEAIAIPPAIAEHLAVPAGTPGLSATHHFLDNRGKVVQVANSTHPTGRATYGMRLKRHRPAG